MATVKRWTAELRLGLAIILEEDRSGIPKEVTIEEMIEKIHYIVLDDQKKSAEIAASVGISTRSVVSILHNDLGMRKHTARMMLRLLTIDQKRERHIKPSSD